MENMLLGAMLNPDKTVRIKVTHIDNPQRFFVMKFDDTNELEAIQAAMNVEYSPDKETQRIYYPKVNMCCAVRVGGKWHRGRVEEIRTPNNLRVRLVDDGRSVTASWRQLYVLKERFLRSREISIECSLADIQPLQENNNQWTENAIAEFVRMTSNHNIQMTVSSSNKCRYQVILNAVKKHSDINIGAMLVKLKHALSVGEGSAIVENVHESSVVSTENSAIISLKRTPIRVIQSYNPGEFYIHLADQIPGILKFHEQIQVAQEKRSLGNEAVTDANWRVNDHCLILTSVSETYSDQWYRGVIRKIDENEPEAPYTVFLRDFGVLIHDVQTLQLMQIDDYFDRFMDGAILCHQACVHPSDGMKNWSHLAIDEFIYNVSHFESIEATIQGKPTNGSIPVVLWGMLTETNNALGSSTPTYANINEMLVSGGLANLTEKMDITQQMDQFVQEENQENIQQWYEDFKKSLLVVDEDSFKTSELNNSNVPCYELYDLTDKSEIVTKWLPAEPIEKTIFTAYPTYVDYDATVYMHDAEKHTFLSRMREKINEEIILEPTKSTDENWAPGQPCLARYHLDLFLYRAVIECCLPNRRFVVKFVDYGNVETCKIDDLYRMTPFANIPIQAIPFSIDGMRPKGGQDSYPIPVLDLMHGLIVNKMCAIQVSYGEENAAIKKCKIRIDGFDLANYLILNDFVIDLDAE